MTVFWKLLEKSTITSGLIAVLMIGTACYCVIVGRELPEFFSVALGTILGYFFSEKISRGLQARSGE